MTASEFADFRRRAIVGYAADNVQAGNWSEDEAEELAAKATDEVLPQGVDTPGMLLLVAQTAAGEAVGMVWVSLTRPQGEGAWIYDIEVIPEQRGRGYGRALLEAAERECMARGVGMLGLNVFGPNTVARRLYESAGYEVTTMQMRKSLS